MRIYIDTSVVGGCFDSEFDYWSKSLFGEFKLGAKIAVISDVTLQELEGAPDFVRETVDSLPAVAKEIVFADDRVINLANTYIAEGAITKSFFNDALHIALATTNRVDVLVSWNFKHIVNLSRIRLYNSVNLKLGYALIEIRSPREVLK